MPVAVAGAVAVVVAAPVPVPVPAEVTSDSHPTGSQGAVPGPAGGVPGGGASKRCHVYAPVRTFTTSCVQRHLSIMSIHVPINSCIICKYRHSYAYTRSR